MSSCQSFVKALAEDHNHPIKTSSKLTSWLVADLLLAWRGSRARPIGGTGSPGSGGAEHAGSESTVILTTERRLSSSEAPPVRVRNHSRYSGSWSKISLGGWLCRLSMARSSHCSPMPLWNEATTLKGQPVLSSAFCLLFRSEC